MTQTYFPFDAGNGANVTESQWTKMAQKWLATGVLVSEGNQLETYADSTGMQVKVGTGKAWMKGHFYENSAEVTLPVSVADASNGRIDRVVLQLDWTNNIIQLAVLEGTPAVSPSVPALTQSSSIWEIGLAQVTVDATVTTIAAGDVALETGFVADPFDLEDLLKWWASAGAFGAITVITRDSNGVVTAATVTWPDGSSGAFTGVADTTWVTKLSSFAVTHEDSGKTVTQTAITYGSDWTITTIPEMTVG